jgi:acyl carrier protein
MTRAEILAAVEEVAATHLGLAAPLLPEQRLVEDLRLDSLKLLTLAVEVENRFRVRIEPEAEATIRTVGDLVAAVEGLLSA